MSKFFTKRALTTVIFLSGTTLFLSSLAWQPVLQDPREKEITALRLEQAKNDLAEAIQKDAYRGAQLKMLESQAEAEKIRQANDALEEQVKQKKESPKA